MVIVSVRIGEGLCLQDKDNQVRICVQNINKKRVSVGIEADVSLEVMRTEVYKKAKAELTQQLESYHYQHEVLKRQGDVMSQCEEVSLRPRVLLVEDTDIIRIANSYLLANLMCEVDAAMNGRQALDLFNQNHYDLILLDIGLPDITGIQVCQKIRKQLQEQGRAIPIVFLTALGEDVKTNCLKAGGSDFASKPITIECLGQLIQKWLPGHQITSNLAANEKF